MIIRKEMIKAICRSAIILGDRVLEVVLFLKKHFNEDGGFRGRSLESDPYYTLFASETLLALGDELPAKQITNYLNQFLQSIPTDLVHLAAVIRCYANFAPDELVRHTGRLVERIEDYRRRDAGYSCQAEQCNGSSYGCFLAMGAYQDLGKSFPDRDGVIHFLRTLHIAGSGYANEPGLEIASTPAAAAALTTLHQLQADIQPEQLQWLASRCTQQGGYEAIEGINQSDLLSTAVAIHCLSVCGGADLIPHQRCLDFVNRLYRDGGFCSGAAEDTLDCEYTYYGLLALGHIADNV